MNQIFLIILRSRAAALSLNVLFLIVLLAPFGPPGFGQTIVLTRKRFSGFSLLKRARLFEPTISRIAAEEQVDPYLLWTIAYNETRFRPWLRSRAGAEGLMQFVPATAARFNLFSPYQPEPAIRAAARYVNLLSNRFDGRIDSILAGYNAGEGAVDAFLKGKPVRADDKTINGRGIKTAGGVPPYQETVRYVARGLVVYRMLRERQLFSGAVAPLSAYPLTVSESVARVWFRDPEIGFSGSLLTQISNLSFFNAELIQQNNFAPVQSNLSAVQARIQAKNNVRRGGSPDFQINTPVPSAREGSKDSLNKGSTENKRAKARNEVYYEPRTGARFHTGGGKMERLADDGELIIGEQLRSSAPSAPLARGTFFGSLVKRSSDK